MGRSTIRLLAISGSLRPASSNTALLRAAAALAPEAVDIALYEGVAGLPYFNPELEETLPPPVVDFRAKVKAADGILISSPEYAHGVPGAFKNALDWLVGGEEFVDKPVALFNASPRASYAQESLAEILRTMSGRIVAEASVALPLLGQRLDVDGIVSNREMASTLRNAIAAFARAIDTDPARANPG